MVAAEPEFKTSPIATTYPKTVTKLCKEHGVIIVIDPFSSGRYLVDELHRRGEKVVCVRSTQDALDKILNQAKKEDFHGFYDVSEGETPEMVASNLEKAYGQARAVFVGSEIGLMLAEQLQKIWGFPSNDASNSELRRNKAMQQDRLRECGLRSIKQLFSADINEILAFRRANLEFPVVIKPPMAAATDGVYFCNNDDQVIDAFNANYGRTDILGNKTDKVLLQEFLQGIEWVIDTMSYEGQHYVAAMWRYKKIADVAKRAITYEYTEFMPSHGDVQQQLIDYVINDGVLDALGIRYGPSHVEVMMTPTGPCLVEAGNRLHGADGPMTASRCTGCGQHELVTDMVLGGSRFENWTKQGLYKLKKKAVCLMLCNSSKSGVLARDINCPELRKACEKSAIDIECLEAGDKLQVTRCMMTSPGEILLCHEDEQVVWDEIAAIRELERTGFLYQVQPERKTSVKEVDTASEFSSASGQTSQNNSSIGSRSISEQES